MLWKFHTSKDPSKREPELEAAKVMLLYPNFLADRVDVSNGGYGGFAAGAKVRRLKFRPQNSATSETDGPTSTILYY